MTDKKHSLNEPTVADAGQVANAGRTPPLTDAGHIAPPLTDAGHIETFYFRRTYLDAPEPIKTLSPYTVKVRTAKVNSQILVIAQDLAIIAGRTSVPQMTDSVVGTSSLISLRLHKKMNALTLFDAMTIARDKLSALDNALFEELAGEIVNFWNNKP